jgi:tetratricopeptide (TPR) repeat protein
VAKRGDGRDSRTRRAGRACGLVVAAALLAAPAWPQAKAAAAAAQQRPIALVGVDGGDWLAIDRLVARGELPSFARLKARGRTGLMRAAPPLVSPILWTTIATGRRPEDHRVLDLAPSERRVSALWNLLSARERTVAVVGWPEPGSPPDSRALSPASRAAELAKLLVRPDQLAGDDLAGYGALGANERLAAAVAAERSHERLAEALLKPKQPDLLMVRLDGVDALSHLFVRDAARGPTAIDEAYRDVDAFLGRLALAVRPETWIVVASAHGFYTKDAGIAADPAPLSGPATAWHRAYGIVAAIEARELRSSALGTPVPRDVGSVTALDIAPTILQAAGLSPSIEMPGRVVDTLLPPEAKARPIVRVRSLEGPRPASATPTTPLGRVTLGEILYRRGDLAGAERELRAVVADQAQNAPALLWLAKTVAAQGRAPEALELYERSLAVDPAGDVLLEAVELAIHGGSADAARRLLGRFPPRPEARADAAVARAVVAASAGQPRQAESELRAALGADAAHVAALERLLELLRGSGRSREALTPLRRAAELAPDSAPIQALLGSALLASGDAAAAEAPLGHALQLVPDSPSVALELVRVDLAQGRVPEAQARLARLPTSGERSALLGVVATRAGVWEEAARRYREALAASPLDKDLLNALGWALYKSGRSREAADFLDRSLAIDAAQPEIRRLRAELSAPETP